MDVDTDLRERKRVLHGDREEAHRRRRGAFAVRRTAPAGASVDAEVVNTDCATIAQNSGQTTVEQGNGVYKVGPIYFQKGGKWVVRFHFNECCSDDPADSPHGHAAFLVNVP